jgi:hypothetical protein
MTTRKRPSPYDRLRLGHELLYVQLAPGAEWHRIEAAYPPGYTACGMAFDPWRVIFAREPGIGVQYCRECFPPKDAA